MLAVVSNDGSECRLLIPKMNEQLIIRRLNPHAKKHLHSVQFSCKIDIMGIKQIVPQYFPK